MLGVALAVLVDAPFGGDRRAVHDKDPRIERPDSVGGCAGRDSSSCRAQS